MFIAPCRIEKEHRLLEVAVTTSERRKDFQAVTGYKHLVPNGANAHGALRIAESQSRPGFLHFALRPSLSPLA